MPVIAFFHLTELVNNANTMLSGHRNSGHSYLVSDPIEYVKGTQELNLREFTGQIWYNLNINITVMIMNYIEQ